MEQRAEYLLQFKDDVLFAHGGCHIFAQVLHRLTGFPLVAIRNDTGRHNHVACVPEKLFILDVYGWWSQRSYIEEEGRDLGIRFYPLRLDELEQKYVLEDGQGFYAHPDFVGPASNRANKWIATYSDYFDGSKKCPIPGHSRIKSSTNATLTSIFG